MGKPTNVSNVRPENLQTSFTETALRLQGHYLCLRWQAPAYILLPMSGLLCRPNCARQLYLLAELWKVRPRDCRMTTPLRTTLLWKLRCASRGKIRQLVDSFLPYGAKATLALHTAAGRTRHGSFRHCGGPGMRLGIMSLLEGAAMAWEITQSAGHCAFELIPLAAHLGF